MSDQLTILAHYEDAQLAARHADHLQEAGIPCVIETVHHGDFYALDTPVQVGDTLLKVPPEQAAHAHDLLDALDFAGTPPNDGQTYMFAGALMALVGLLTSFGQSPPGGGAIRLLPYGLVILGLALFARGWLSSRS